MPISRHNVAIVFDIAAVKPACALAILILCCDLASAAAVPLPRPRPMQTEPAATQAAPDEPPPPSACRLRLTEDFAIAPSLPALAGPGACGVDDVVRLEAVVLADKSHIALTPPATVRCTLAEALVHWIREDAVPAVKPLGASLRSVDNYASYDCRGRNRIAGARLSEHAKANALDIRSVKLANGTVVGLTDPHVAKNFREGLRRSTCARFSTVLGPGSDGYHEDHVHVDLAERRGDYRICHWDVREPEEAAPAATDEQVPLPRPRPTVAVKRQ